MTIDISSSIHDTVCSTENTMGGARRLIGDSCDASSRCCLIVSTIERIETVITADMKPARKTIIKWVNILYLN